MLPTPMPFGQENGQKNSGTEDEKQKSKAQGVRFKGITAFELTC